MLYGMNCSFCYVLAPWPFHCLRVWSLWLLIWKMAVRFFFGAKPLHQPTMTHSQSPKENKYQGNFNQTTNNFLARKYRLPCAPMTIHAVLNVFCARTYRFTYHHICSFDDVAIWGHPVILLTHILNCTSDILMHILFKTMFKNWLANKFGSAMIFSIGFQ